MGWGSTGRVVTAVFRLECRFLLVDDAIVALLEVLLHEWKFSCGLIMLGHPPLLPWWRFKCEFPLEFSDDDTCTSTCETLWAWGNCALQVLTNMAAEFSASVLDRWLVLEIRRVLFIILLSDSYCFYSSVSSSASSTFEAYALFLLYFGALLRGRRLTKRSFFYFSFSLRNVEPKLKNTALDECTWNFFWWPSSEF